MLPTTLLALLLASSFHEAFALPRFPRVEIDIHSRTLNYDTAIAARQIAEAIEAISLERRLHQGFPRPKGSSRPSLTLQTKSVCESGKYQAVPNISALACARQVPIAFQVGSKCYLASEHDLAAMGPTTMGTCFLHSRAG
ncbi:hypothetical protein BDZ94DRAFT_1248399 [Collybia nuda]|uniref:Uncharacterized protein n=1 Tax=Collybia nuda TaxID=64659 RepID=A0A9P5YGR1_9AGAR|nr:hypothetical protein BDZ94DRAFT_1248399 [Collybia nuda]